MVVYGAAGFVGNDADYARCDVPPEHPELSWSVGTVRYSSLDGSHRVFILAFDSPLGPGKPTIAVTNNPFITTWNDACRLDFEGF